MTNTFPKPALPVLDVPLVVFALEQLTSFGPSIVNVSYLAPVIGRAITEHLGTRSPELLLEGPTGLGTAATLRTLTDRLAEDVLVWNADALTDVDPASLLAAHRQGERPLTLAVTRVDVGADLVQDAGRLRFIDRRTRAGAAGYRYIGVAAIRHDALETLDDDEPPGLAEALFRPLADGRQITIHVHEGYALDVGTPARYLQANLDVLDGRAPAPGALIPGTIGETDAGRVYVGPGASAPADALGGGAVIMQGASVAEGAFVQNAVVWPGEAIAGGTIVDGIYAGGAMVGGRESA